MMVAGQMKLLLMLRQIAVQPQCSVFASVFAGKPRSRCQKLEPLIFGTGCFNDIITLVVASLQFSSGDQHLGGTMVV